MSTPSIDNEGKKKNTQALISLILGIGSVVLALGNFAPGFLSVLGCVGATAALLALVAGVRGIRAAVSTEGTGRVMAYAGMGFSVLGLVIFIVIMGTNMARGVTLAEEISTPQPPQVFQADTFTLLYPDNWISTDISQQEFCQQVGVDCFVALSPSGGETTNLTFMRFALDRPYTIDELDQMLWSQFLSMTSDVVLDSVESIEIAGVPAIRRTFNIPSTTQDSEGRAYYQQVYVIQGLTFIQFTVYAPSEGSLSQYLEQMNAIIESLTFNQ